MKLKEALQIKSTGNDRLDSFMEEFYEETSPHPFDRASRVYDHSVIELSPFNGAIHLSAVVSMQPRSGQGTKALNFIKELANKHRVKIELSAKPFSNNKEHITDLGDLVRWYVRNGFRITDDLVDDVNDIEGAEEVNMTYFPR